MQNNLACMFSPNYAGFVSMIQGLLIPEIVGSLLIEIGDFSIQ